jgi:minor extracellular serine protease Vpr
MRRRSIRISLLALLTAAAAACLDGPVVDPGSEEPLAEHASALGAPSLPAAGSPGSEDESAKLWLVELTSPPIAAGGDRAAVRMEKNVFRAEAAAAGLSFTERLSFDTLWNGLSVEIHPRDRAKLARVRGVKRVFPVLAVEPEMANAVKLTNADAVWSTLNYKGEGIKVGVIDSGIDYHHKDLGSCFGPGCHVGLGYDFVGDAFNSANPVLVPDNDPDDCGGHGTHVAGIIGADRTLKGVAPKVTLGAYRVFGCTGSTLSDIMIQAMERALADGMQVVNMSIGSAFAGWKEYPTATAADNLVQSGVVVVCSAGNSGTSGLYATGAPGLGEHVIATAMFDNTHTTLRTATLADGSPLLYSNATAAPLAPTSGTGTLAKHGTPSSTNDACTNNPLPAGYFTGKIALVRRGTCGFYEKAKNAEAAGAVAMVLYNNVAGRQSITVAGNPAVNIPVIAVSDVEGVAMNNLIEGGNTLMTWNDTVGTITNASAKLLNADSSYGLTATLDLKPDVGAPGGYIYSTYPLELGGYASLNGTSMASPHVAGAVAHLLPAHRGLPPAGVRATLQNTAQPMLWSGNPGLGALDVVHRQGAGMINIPKAINAPARVMPSKLALGESEAGPAVRTLTVQNLTDKAIQYTLSHQAAVSTTAGTTHAPTNANSGAAAVGFSAPMLTVPALGTAQVDVTITANAGLINKGLYGGYIVLTDAEGGTLRVPYSGFKGDYQSIKVLAPTASNFPWISYQSNGSYFFAQSGTPFTMVGADVPYILVHLDHQARLLRVTAISRTGVNWGEAYLDEFLTRNSTATSFFAIAWDGTTMQGGQLKPVPNGQYSLKLEVLKALGDENNPAHWETWQSPYLAVKKP